MSKNAVRKQVQRQTLEGMLLYAGTTSVVSRFDEWDIRGRVLVLDEAAQAGEPDSVIACAAQPDLDLFIMAGDPRQLGPVVLSHQARRNHLSNVLTKSMMARVLHGFPRITSVALNVNYRSHPSIVALGSELFYDGNMIAGRTNLQTPLAAVVRGLLTGPDFRAAVDQRMLAQDKRQVFFNVEGFPVQAANGHSWTNPAGVAAIVTLITKLARAGASLRDLGVITMYKEDQAQLRTRLAAANLADVEVEVAIVDS